MAEYMTGEQQHYDKLPPSLSANYKVGVIVLEEWLSSIWIRSKIIGFGAGIAVAVVTGIGTLFIALFALPNSQSSLYIQCLEIGVPVLVGVLFAYIVAPTSDPCIELIVTYQSSMVFVRLARLLTFLIEVILILFVWTSIFAVMRHEAFTLPFFYFAIWFPPLLFFTGIAVFGAAWSARGEIGVAYMIVVWLGCLVVLFAWDSVSDVTFFQTAFPFIVAASDSLQPLNRFVLVLAGSVLLTTALFLPVNETQLFGTYIQNHRKPASEMDNKSTLIC